MYCCVWLPRRTRGAAGVRASQAKAITDAIERIAAALEVDLDDLV